MAIDGIGSADAFAQWQDSAENIENYANGEKVDDFEMFKNDGSQTYEEAIGNFSQEFINKYDLDGDGKMNFEEFVEWNKESYNTMYGEVLDVSDESITEMLKEAFSDLSGRVTSEDGEDAYIDASDYADELERLDTWNGDARDGVIAYDNFLDANGYNDAIEAEGIEEFVNNMDAWADFINGSITFEEFLELNDASAA